MGALLGGMGGMGGMGGGPGGAGMFGEGEDDDVADFEAAKTNKSSTTTKPPPPKEEKPDPKAGLTEEQRNVTFFVNSFFPLKNS